MIEVIPCGQNEVTSVRLQEMQAEDFWEGYEGMEENSRAVVCSCDVIAAMGVIPLAAGTGFAWTMLSGEAVSDHAVGVSAVAYRNLLRIQKRDHLHRVQAMVRAGHDVGLHWLDRMGFEIEGYMKAYDSQKRDYWTLARIWSC